MLYIFGGLPGTGKSTLARQLACGAAAVYLRVDTIEQALRETAGRLLGPEGYVIGYRLAEDNLRLGRPVVADTVNPLEITRSAWRAVAARIGQPFVEIEVVCTDQAEHRVRVETRPAEVAGLRLPTWPEVLAREYEPWETDHLRIDTAGQTPAQSLQALHAALAAR